ncbi:ferric reduction oxidase 4-like protein [Tanacetum coccineum]
MDPRPLKTPKLDLLSNKSCAFLISYNVLGIFWLHIPPIFRTILPTKGLEYTPSSILFVNVPLISKRQWHPFTVTSNANMDPDTLSIVIKCQGTWSHKLYQQLSSSPIDRLQVSVEGPYGPASPHFLRLVLDLYENLVLISGGSGITPFISIIRELSFQRARQQQHPNKNQTIPAKLAKGPSAYNYTFKTLWDMFFVCASVFLATSFVFLWQKKDNDKREATKCKLGAIEEMLLENNKKGSAVGVMACGPRKMRHEVAKICSSSLARNLHLESMSFNW